MNTSERIIKKLKDNNVRFHADDNINKWVNPVDMADLIDELTEKFDGVLRSLIIDVDNDPYALGFQVL